MCVVVVVVCACGVVWHADNTRVYIQNVPVCTGTTPACVTTCGRGAGTHGDVLNVHTGGVLNIHTGRGVEGGVIVTHTAHSTQHTAHTTQHTTPTHTHCTPTTHTTHNAQTHNTQHRTRKGSYRHSAIHETTFLNGESFRIDGGSRTVKLQTVVRVNQLWRGQHSNSYIQVGDEMVLLNAELNGYDSKKPCCIKSFDGISVEKMIRSD